MDKPEPRYQPYYNDEITLKELILKILEYWKEIKRNKFLILITAISGAAVLLIWNQRKPVTYTSAMTFMVGEADDKNSGVMGSPFDQLQFQGIKNHKLTEIARSSKIVHRVLLSLDSASMKSQANQIVEIYGLKNKWSEIEWDKIELSKAGISKYSEQTKVLIIDRLHEFLVGNKLNRSASKGLMNFTYDGDTEIFQVNVETIDKKLSNSLMENFYKALSEFYIENTVGKPARVFKQLQSREDSLKILLNNAESGLAYASDRTRGVVSSVAKVNQSRLQRKLENLTELYNETRANRQKIEFVLQTETPDFQVIDQTFIPVITKASKLKSAILGLTLGGFISILFVLSRYIIMNALRS